jgi:hypothetical protein
MLYDLNGKLIAQTTLYQGSTIAYLDTQSLANGQYLVQISNSKGSIAHKVVIAH